MLSTVENLIFETPSMMSGAAFSFIVFYFLVSYSLTVHEPLGKTKQAIGSQCSFYRVKTSFYATGIVGPKFLLCPVKNNYRRDSL